MSTLPEVSKNNNAIDEELIAHVANHNKEAFDNLLTRHMNGLYSVAYRMRMSQSDAEDVIQEVMMKVWQRADSWREGGASVRTWMFTITHNVCIDFKRKNKRPHLELIEEPKDKSPSAEEMVAEKETGEIVAESISELPDNQKAAVILTHYEKLSNAEVAQAMDTTVKAVESLLVRARKTLFKDLRTKRMLFM